ncbi:hypothetical protein MED222_05880 [Vibrio sp. MED222]|nr:hypothetical protein MED222_05880 [Vibrio sp. MED222]
MPSFLRSISAMTIGSCDISTSRIDSYDLISARSRPY